MNIIEPDFSQDSQTWDDCETVVYFAKSAELPPSNGVNVSGVYWDEITKSMTPADGPMAVQEATVELPGRILAALTPAITPKVNDIMQRADGTRWTIKNVKEPISVDWQVQVVKGNK